jgi:CHAD domain-containing protein
LRNHDGPLAGAPSPGAFWVVTSIPPVPVPPIAVADAALVALAERRTAVRAERRRFLATPDPDALHDLRVAIRRLRAALALFEPALELPRRCRDTRWRRLGRTLSGLRDADVLRAALTSDEAVSADVADDLVEWVEAERQEAARRAERALRRRRTRRMLRSLKRWERQPRFTVTPDDLIGTTLPPRLLACADRFVAHPGWGLKLRRDADGHLEDATGTLDRDGVLDTLHSLRRQAKRMRYQLEIAAPLLGLDERDAVEHLKAMQDALGELQDVRVIEAALAELPPAERPRDGVGRWLGERRYRALEQWRRLRRDRGDRVRALVPSSGLPGAD